MSQLDEFRSTILARQAEAERAIVLGDPAPRMELWSRRDPITLFGAATGECKSGWDALSPIFRWVASMFSDVSDFRFDVEVADVNGDLAYTKVIWSRARQRSMYGRFPALTMSFGDREERWRWRELLFATAFRPVSMVMARAGRSRKARPWGAPVGAPQGRF